MMRATTNSDAWQQLLRQFLAEGWYRQDIQRGSFAGEAHRRQLPPVAVMISHPLADMVPDFRPGVAPTTSVETIDTYFSEYLVGTRRPTEHESYTYASRIGLQLPFAMEALAATPETNQVSISVGRPEDMTIDDPACLRLIDFKSFGGELHMSTFWRSHDLWSGFLTNLGGLSLLLAHVSEYAGLRPGAHYYFSAGTHLYSYQMEQYRLQVGQG